MAPNGVIPWALSAAAAVGLLSSFPSPAAAAATEPLDVLPDYQISSAMLLSLNYQPLSLAVTETVLIPLTEGAGLNLTDNQRDTFSFTANFVAADEGNFNSISGSDTIAYLPCEPDQNGSFIEPTLMLNALIDNKPRAIVLYNLNGNGCSLSDHDEVKTGFSSIYTMNDQLESNAAFNMTLDGDVIATVRGDTNITDSDDPETTTRQDQGNNSAVAMSILYSITGLITLLFLIIIATGAIRAHRYPERYGPRTGLGGGPGRSRAKGIAIAVLETLPIIKFGDSQPDATLKDPERDHERDHELQSIPEDRELETTAGTQLTTPSAKQPETDAQEAPEAQQTSTAEASATAATAAATPAPTATAAAATTADHGDDGLGCSICTEDFHVGEDVRVLPCDHKFHPGCVDHWLLQVSGTCPLCRLDLRPPGERDEDADPNSPVADQHSLAPPLETDDSLTVNSGSQSRRMSRILDWNWLRQAPPEERIRALRRIRTETEERQGSQLRGASPANEEDRRRRAKLTDRLLEKFRIRTTRRTQTPSRPSSRAQSSGPAS